LTEGRDEGQVKLESERIKLDFFGHTYYLKADDPGIDIREVVEYVQEKLREQESTNKSLPHHKLVVLAVLNIGKEYIQVKNRLKQLEREIASDAERLAIKIDEVLAPKR